MTLKANPHYFLGAPIIENCEMKIIQDKSTIAMALETGEVHYSSAIGIEATVNVQEMNAYMSNAFTGSVDLSMMISPHDLSFR